MTKTAVKPAEFHVSREFTIETEADLDAALLELATLQTINERLTTECNAEIASITEEYQALKRVTVGEVDVPIADHSAKITAACLAWCKKNRVAVLGDEKKKSRAYTHGSITWRNDPPGIIPLEGKDEAVLLKAIADVVVPQFNDILRGHELGEGVFAESFVNAEINWDKQRIITSHSTSKLTDAQLAAAGWQMKEKSEKFSLKPAATAVAAHSEAKPKKPRK